MGKSTSCFKIITCSSDSRDEDDIDITESKGSSDKRGWSFRKKSARHRVLSNSVINETISGNKENVETANLVFQQPDNSTVLEKISLVHCTSDKPQLSPSENPKISETKVPAENECKVDDESVVIVIQAAIRGILAQRELVKLKNVVKLQATIRGHLVRRHAVGTLRCIQAIIKMQALARARHARISMERSYREKLDREHEKDRPSSKTLEKEKVVQSSCTERLLSNGFACQLLKSRTNFKSINIKCDPSKSDSAWKWLERWMSISSASIVEPKKADFSKEKIGGEKVENCISQVDTEVSSKSMGSRTISSIIGESVLPTESEDTQVPYDAGSSNLHSGKASFSEKGDLEQPRPESISASIVKETSVEVNSLLDQRRQSETNSAMQHYSHAESAETKTEQKRCMKRLASEQLETGVKKSVTGSRKASNPAFIAAQSRFEESSLTENSGGSISSCYPDDRVEYHGHTISSAAVTVLSTKEAVTKLSISSTCDFHERYEAGVFEKEHGANMSEKGGPVPNTLENLDIEFENAPTSPLSAISQAVLDHPENLDVFIGESINSEVSMDYAQAGAKPLRNVLNLERERDTVTDRQVHRLSPDASPRSLVTVPESQGTPSSLVSVKANGNKTEKSGSCQKRKSLSIGKRSPSIQNHDSSMDHLPRDQKNGKRRNSFGSARPDHIPDEEPRDSITDNSLPRFMQATESARAKLLLNDSPRSSPDVQDRDISLKKRHSLSGSNGRQGSPRIQRSMSQTQHGVKENERKWQR